MSQTEADLKKIDFVEEISARTGVSKTKVKAVIDEFIEVFDEWATSAEVGSRIYLKGLGVFEVAVRGERVAMTGFQSGKLRPIKVPARRVIKYRPPKHLRKRRA